MAFSSSRKHLARHDNIHGLAWLPWRAINFAVKIVLFIGDGRHLLELAGGRSLNSRTRRKEQDALDDGQGWQGIHLGLGWNGFSAVQRRLGRQRHGGRVAHEMGPRHAPLVGTTCCF